MLPPLSQVMPSPSSLTLALYMCCNLPSRLLTCFIVQGMFKHSFEARRVMYKLNRTWRLFCLEPNCTHQFSPKSSSTTLCKHFLACHPQALAKLEKKKTESTQPTIEDVTAESRRQAVVTSALQWIISDMLPFSTFNSVAFREFMATCNSGLKLPCSATVRSHLTKHRLRLTESLRGLMDKTLIYGSLTADGWSSGSNKPYLGITLHWLDSNFNYFECALDMAPQPYPHTAVAITRLMSKYAA
jgi:hypothetical protein